MNDNLNNDILFFSVLKRHVASLSIFRKKFKKNYKTFDGTRASPPAIFQFSIFNSQFSIFNFQFSILNSQFPPQSLYRVGDNFSHMKPRPFEKVVYLLLDGFGKTSNNFNLTF